MMQLYIPLMGQDMYYPILYIVICHILYQNICIAHFDRKIYTNDPVKKFKITIAFGCAQ